MREREREGGGGFERETERERQREAVERERERERERGGFEAVTLYTTSANAIVMIYGRRDGVIMGSGLGRLLFRS